MSASVHQLRPHIPAALQASGVGTWEYDVLAHRCFFDTLMASMLGFGLDDIKDGVDLDRVRERLHPADRDRGMRTLRPTIRSGGVFVFEFRAYPKPDTERWLLGRGRYESGGGSDMVFARGIAVDVTDAKTAGLLSDPTGLLPSLPSDLSAPERAADGIIAAHQAITEMGGDARPSLLPMAELMLHEIGFQIGSGLKKL